MSLRSNSGRLPDFLILGAMRSGTTSLYRYLAAHPEVFLVPKELQFFTDHWDRGVEWYERQFSGADSAAILGEATADYLARQSAMTRIASTLPHAKLVASLRNPVDRAWSHYGLLTERGVERRSFTDALDAELDILAANGPGASGVFYLSHGLYDVHLERCFRLFDPAQVHVIIFERMKLDVGGTYRSLCTHIGADPSFVPANLGESVNAYTTFRSLRLRAVTKRLPKSAGRIVGRLNSKPNATPPPLPSGARDRLIEFYADPIRRVEQLLGYAVPEWQP